MGKGCTISLIVGGVIVFALFLFGMFLIGTYNSMVTFNEDATAGWAQVENQYQRRFDLIPNLVSTVKGYAKHESETFILVTEARSKVGQINIKASDLNDPAKLKQFQSAQDGLSGALSKLMVVIEKYPDLKANKNFLALQSQLEGTENRIAVERRRFNESVKVYNKKIKQFPANMMANMFGFSERPYFEGEEGTNKAPKVEF